MEIHKNLINQSFYKFIIVFCLVVLMTSISFMILGKPLTGIDDANIFLVYGKNVADGNGFVYNIGGEKVEGFTSFLWVIIISFLFRFFRNPEIHLVILNILIISLTLFATIRFIDKSLSSHHKLNSDKVPFVSFASLIFLAWVFSCPNYICWTTLSLMETGIWSSLLIIISLILLKSSENEKPSRTDRVLLAVIMPLLILTRPEGMLWGLFYMGLYFLIMYLQSRRLQRALATVFAPFLTYITTLFALKIFRVTYFGYPLPNTYYAKVSPDLFYNLKTGVSYFIKFITSNAFISIHLIAALTGTAAMTIHLIRKKKSHLTHISRTRLSFFIISIIVLAGIALPILVGGDHFKSFRFYQPVWPLLILPSMYWSFRLRRQIQALNTRLTRKQHKSLVLILVLILFSFLNDSKWHSLDNSDLMLEFSIAEGGRKLGQTLNKMFQPDSLPTVGVIASGGIKYSYSGPVNDLMGLNNIAMAHHPGDRKGIKNHASFNKKIFYQQKPEVMLPRIINSLPRSNPYKGAWLNIPLKGLLDEYLFQNIYKLAVLKRIDIDYDKYILAFFRNDFLKLLTNQDHYEVKIIGE